MCISVDHTSYIYIYDIIRFYYKKIVMKDILIWHVLADTVMNGMVVLVDDVCCSHYFGCPVQFLPDDRPYVTICLLRE